MFHIYLMSLHTYICILLHISYFLLHYVITLNTHITYNWYLFVFFTSSISDVKLFYFNTAINTIYFKYTWCYKSTSCFKYIWYILTLKLYCQVFTMLLFYFNYTWCFIHNKISSIFDAFFIFIFYSHLNYVSTILDVLYFSNCQIFTIVLFQLYLMSYSSFWFQIYLMLLYMCFFTYNFPFITSMQFLKQFLYFNFTWCFIIQLCFIYIWCFIIHLLFCSIYLLIPIFGAAVRFSTIFFYYISTLFLPLLPLSHLFYYNRLFIFTFMWLMWQQFDFIKLL